MKKIPVACLFILKMFLSHGKSQPMHAVDQGSMTANGSANLYLSKGDLYGNNGDFRLYMNPAVSRYVGPNIALGGTVRLLSNMESNVWGIRPSFSSYIGDGGSCYYPFISTEILYTQWTDQGYTQVDFRASGGLASMNARNIAYATGGYLLLENVKWDLAAERSTGIRFGVQFGVTAFLF